MKETSKLEDLEVGYPKDILKMKEMKPYLGGYSILPLSKALPHDHRGIKYKEWNVSRENFTQEAVSVHLPHTIGVDKEPPGVFWNVSKDEIYSSRLDISYLGGDNTLPLSKALPPISLTIRICLLVHAKTDTKYLSPSCLLPATMKTRFLDKKKEVTSHKPQVKSQEIGSHESQATSQDTGGGVTKMRSQ